MSIHKGFTQKSEEQVMCRFFYQDILVDVMSTREVGWAPANKWFMEGFFRREKVDLGNGIFINILPMAYFLAAKWDAYHSRGNDPRTSHDFEDIIYLLDNTLDFASDIISSPQTVKEYLQFELASLLSSEMYEAVLGHMNPFSRKERFPMLLEKLNMIFTSRK
ncbi:MAG: hypothetical protein FJY10_08535 [Bacteroidetes bacterium]|nr:hypothetical protein [Bacteroidota bacterium]